jgi:uncharacterized protein YndB with AHSA1/START domain
MTVIETITDDSALTLTVTAQFKASPQRVWEVWENPRYLERWWGPPTWPATFTRHDFSVGGESRYFMTGPDGDKSRGYWRMFVIEEPHHLEFANGLAGDDGEPMDDVPPMGGYVTLQAIDGGTRMTVLSTFVDEENMKAMLDRGMSEGMQQAIGQIDAVLG